MKKILVPTDFSEASLAALKVAVVISRKGRDMKIRLAHSYKVPRIPSTSNYDYGFDGHKQKEIVNDLHKKLNTIAKYDFTKGVKIETQIIPHIKVTEILKYKDNKESDLIVCGIHGSKEWKHFIEGSNAEEIIRTSPCPVLCVNENMNWLRNGSGSPTISASFARIET